METHKPYMCDTPMEWVQKRCEKELVVLVVGFQKETGEIHTINRRNIRLKGSPTCVSQCVSGTLDLWSIPIYYHDDDKFKDHKMRGER